MTNTTDTTWELFHAAAVGDADADYPDDVTFVSGEEDWSGDVVARNVRAGTPTVVVFGEFEILITRRHESALRTAWSRVFARSAPVLVRMRWHKERAPVGFATRLGADPLTEMRAIANA